MDLNQLDVKAGADAGAVLELLHPVTGEVLKDDSGVPFSLTLIGMDSAQYRKKVKLLSASKRGKSRDSEKDGVDLLVSATTACNLVLDGEKVKLSAMADIYERYPWIAEQAIAFMADRGNFIKS